MKRSKDTSVGGYQKKIKLELEKPNKVGHKFERNKTNNGSTKFQRDAKTPTKNAFTSNSKSKKFGAEHLKRKKFGDKSGETPEKTDWNKFKQEKKDLKLKRKQNKDLFELSAQGKKIYEKLKCKGTPEKDLLAKELHGLLRGGNNYQKLVLAHDTARIVQCLLKYSPSDIRREISENLIPLIVPMSISKYAHFCVSRMIKYGTPDIKQKVIDAIYGSVIKMISNSYSSTVIDTIYISWAKSQQKSYMRQEFYGDLYKQSKDSSVKCIADTYRESTQMKAAVLNSVKVNLNRVVNKKFIDNSLVHSVLLDFLNQCSDEDKAEMTVAFSPYIPSLASTKDGVRASMIFFWNSIVKDRRAIVKNLRQHLIKLCVHEHGHVLILAIINSMDDTKGLKKAVFDEIFSQIEFVVSNEWGRKIIEWFVSPDDPSLFHPKQIAYLEEGLSFSKKDKNIRRSELFSAVEEPLCRSLIENPTFWLRGGHTGLVTVAILKNCKNSDLIKQVYDKLADVICDPEWKVPLKEINEKTAEEKAQSATIKKINKKYKVDNTEEESKLDEKKLSDIISGIEHAGLHIVLKKILKSDKEKYENGLPTFGASIMEKLTVETIKPWILLNRPSFVLLNIYENGTDETCQLLKKMLSGHVALLTKQTHAGSKLIKKNMNL